MWRRKCPPLHYSISHTYVTPRTSVIIYTTNLAWHHYAALFDINSRSAFKAGVVRETLTHFFSYFHSTTKRWPPATAILPNSNASHLSKASNSSYITATPSWILPIVLVLGKKTATPICPILRQRSHIPWRRGKTPVSGFFCPTSQNLLCAFSPCPVTQAEHKAKQKPCLALALVHLLCFAVCC